MMDTPRREDDYGDFPTSVENVISSLRYNADTLGLYLQDMGRLTYYCGHTYCDIGHIS